MNTKQKENKNIKKKMKNKSIGKNLYIQKYRFNYKKAIRTINQLI